MLLNNVTLYATFVKMAGIYIHIPYCRQACIYCNFHFSTQVKNKPALVDALLLELVQRKVYLGSDRIETIYFGGGTPSLLSTEELDKILNHIYQNFNIEDDLEVTLEANPDDLTPAKLQALKNSGINRLSIGIQSFSSKEIQYLNRIHTVDQALDSIKQAQDLGLTNISIDLIYGIPHQNDDVWVENLNRIITLSIPHFSAYSLTVEPKTQLAHLIKNKIISPIDDAQTASHFQLLMDWAENNKFDHYEISNFAKEGKISRHNSSYWLGKKYLGIGPAAHSYNTNTRQWNIASNTKYIKALNENLPYYEIESLNTNENYNEFLLLGLRTKWGVDLDVLNLKFGATYLEKFCTEIKPYQAKGLIKIEDNKIKLSQSGKLLADAIMSDLFIV